MERGRCLEEPSYVKNARVQKCFWTSLLLSSTYILVAYCGVFESVYPKAAEYAGMGILGACFIIYLLSVLIFFPRIERRELTRWRRNLN